MHHLIPARVVIREGPSFQSLPNTAEALSGRHLQAAF